MSLFILPLAANSLKASGPLGAGYVSSLAVLFPVFITNKLHLADIKCKSCEPCISERNLYFHPQPGPGISLSAHIIPESCPSPPPARKRRQSPPWHHPRGAFPAPVPQDWSHRSVFFSPEGVDERISVNNW